MNMKRIMFSILTERDHQEKEQSNEFENGKNQSCQGHIHTEAYVDWYCNKEYRLFACQVGAGVDDRSYAMAYAKNFTRKYIISCAVILDNGKLPLVLPMDLKLIYYIC